jgi:hypothetical protein
MPTGPAPTMSTCVSLILFYYFRVLWPLVNIHKAAEPWSLHGLGVVPTLDGIAIVTASFLLTQRWDYSTVAQNDVLLWMGICEGLRIE